VPQPEEQPFEVILARLFDLAALDVDEVERQFFCATSAWRSWPSEAKFFASSSVFSSKAMKTPGSPESTAARTRNSMARSVLPQPALPHNSVGRPWGKPPPVSSSSP